MTGFLLLAVYGLVATALLVELAFVFAAWPHLLWLIVGLISLGEAAWGSPRALAILGLQLYPYDVVWVCGLIGLALARARSASRPDLPPAAMAMLLAVSISAGIGALLFGVANAGNEARTYLYFLAAFVFTASHPRLRYAAGWLTSVWKALAVGLLALAAAHWVTSGIGSSTSDIRMVEGRLFFSGAIRDARALPVVYAMVIAQAGLIMLFQNSPRRFAAGRLALSAMFFGGVLLLQHRTVWIAFIVGIVVGYLWPQASGDRRARLRIAGISLFAVPIGAILIAGYAPSIAINLSSSAAAAFTENSTFVWRLESWTSLVSRERTFIEWIVGTPFGAGYSRLIGGALVEVNPHNFYIQTLIRLGAVGLSLLFWLLISQAMWLRRQGESVSAASIAILATTSIYFVTYPPTHLQGMILGALYLIKLAVANSSDIEAEDDSCRVSNIPQSSALHA